MLKKKEVSLKELFSLKVGASWRYFLSETFAFWMVCFYLFFEYVRPQSIYPAIDFLPWNQLIIIAAFLSCFFDRSVHWVSSPINILLIIYLILILVSSYFSYFPNVSYDNLDAYYSWVIIYFMIISVINSERRFFIFICIFLIASFKISLFLALVWVGRGFSFTDWGLMGPPGFFENSGELAIQMLVFWPIAWAFVHTVKPYVTKVWYLLLLLMPITAIMVILGASSRGAQVALVIQILILNYRYVFRPKVLISVAMAIFLIWSFLPDEQKDRFERIGEDGTSRQRIVYFTNGLEMIKEHPVTGVGYFNFAPYFERTYPEDLFFGNAQLPHNIFIQVATDTGLIGLFIFIFLLCQGLKLGKNLKSKFPDNGWGAIGRCANISLIGFVVAGQFVTVAYYPFLWIHLALMVSLDNALKNSNLKEKKRARKGRFRHVQKTKSLPNQGLEIR